MIRKIHLDFHTAPETEGIGQRFDAEAFAETLASAHVNYLATPGKCHFGHVYYDAEVAIPHPHLADPEMLPRTVAACLKRGIRTQAYWTLGLDATRAKLTPEWRQRFADGSYANWGHYLHMCFASPYVEQVVIPEVLECIERCPGIVGFWFDISLYVDGAFYGNAFEARARPEGRTSDEERWQLGRQIIRERCMQIDNAIRRVLPEAENYFNTLVNPGEAANLPLVHLNEVENPLLFHGPERMSADIRWLRGQGVDTIGLVSRFQGPWSDPGTLRTPDQMRFDVARTVALGAHISMGDHRYPDGHLEPEVYRRLAPVYADVAALEGLLDAARPLREALLVGSLVAGTGRGLLAPQMSPLTQDAVRVLEELGLQFDVTTTTDPWPNAECIILLGEQPTSPETRERLQAHLARGGALLAMDHAIDGAAELFPATAMSSQHSKEQAAESIGSIGHVVTAGEDSFIRMAPDLIGEDFPALLTLPARPLEAADNAEVLAWRHLPISARPPFASADAASPLIVQHERVIYSSPNLFAEATETGHPQPARMLDALLRRLLPRRLVEHDAGPSLAAHLHTLPDGHLLHLVHWSLDRWQKRLNSSTIFPMLGPIEVTVAVESAVTNVTLEPQGQPLDFTHAEGLCRFVIPSLKVWQTVRIVLAS